MGADMNGDGVVYDRDAGGEHTGIESDGGSENE